MSQNNWSAFLFCLIQTVCSGPPVPPTMQWFRDPAPGSMVLTSVQGCAGLRHARGTRAVADAQHLPQCYTPTGTECASSCHCLMFAGNLTRENTRRLGDPFVRSLRAPVWAYRAHARARVCVVLYCVLWACVALCCVALRCVALCSVVLCCVVLCCVVLCCVVLCCVVMCCVVLCCVVLCCVVLCCVVLCCVVLCCVVLCCVVLFCVVLCCVVLCCVVLCCVVLCCVVLCCVVCVCVCVCVCACVVFCVCVYFVCVLCVCVLCQMGEDQNKKTHQIRANKYEDALPLIQGGGLQHTSDRSHWS